MITGESIRQQKSFRLRFTLIFRLRWIWVAIWCAAFLPQAEAISEGMTSTKAPASEIVSPEEWARLCMEGCRAAQARRDENFARLTQTLAQRAQSSEERSFPNDESRAYDQLLDKERHIHLNQLNYLLFKSKKQVFREVLRHRLPWASDFRSLDGGTFGHAIDILTVGATPCALDALESTLLIAAFGLASQEAMDRRRDQPMPRFSKKLKTSMRDGPEEPISHWKKPISNCVQKAWPVPRNSSNLSLRR